MATPSGYSVELEESLSFLMKGQTALTSLLFAGNVEGDSETIFYPRNIMTILKVRTAGTTVYFINTETREFLRVKGEQSVTDLWFDGDWNGYNNHPEIEVGKSIFFVLNRPMGAWQKTTPVSSVEEVKPEDLPVAKSLANEG